MDVKQDSKDEIQRPALLELIIDKKFAYKVAALSLIGLIFLSIIVAIYSNNFKL